uniref:Uncharacterized protein n=1 Tax=Rhizophora mucronata TaxID=61149 RepID=A0A2P2QQ53_RHIMU
MLSFVVKYSIIKGKAAFLHGHHLSASVRNLQPSSSI